MQHLNYNALDDSVKGFLLQGLMSIYVDCFLEVYGSKM